jgi:hypothetical protein
MLNFVLVLQKIFLQYGDKIRNFWVEKWWKRNLKIFYFSFLGFLKINLPSCKNSKKRKEKKKKTAS